MICVLILVLMDNQNTQGTESQAHFYLSLNPCSNG